MKTLGELLSSQRKTKKISLDKASKDLLIKKEILGAIEEARWEELPEPAFVKGLLRNYAQYLGLNAERILAIYRREYDETKYPTKPSVFDKNKKFFLTPSRIINLTFILAVLAFIVYVIVQYLSILSAPTLKMISPSDNDFSTGIPIIEMAGETEKGATISINGEFVPVDQEGNFSYQYKLEEGQNIIEIISSKRLSPKSKETLTIRLSR